jgi:hypothetical protein
MLKRYVSKEPEPAEPSVFLLVGVLVALFSVFSIIVAGLFKLCY